MNYNAELYVCKNGISALVHKRFKPLKKPMTFYSHIHHIVNQLYANNAMVHQQIFNTVKYSGQ